MASRGDDFDTLLARKREERRASSYDPLTGTSYDEAPRSAPTPECRSTAPTFEAPQYAPTPTYSERYDRRHDARGTFPRDSRDVERPSRSLSGLPWASILKKVGIVLAVFVVGYIVISVLMTLWGMRDSIINIVIQFAVIVFIGFVALKMLKNIFKF